MYYIRRLSKPNTINKIKSSKSITDIPADVLKQEFPTTDNKLSFWKFESFNRLHDSIKTILLSGSAIEKMRLIITDDNLINKYSFRIDDSESGETAYKGFENTHINICDLTYGKIGDILSMLKEIIDMDDYIYELTKDQVKDFIKEACIDGKVDEEHINQHLLDDIYKYGLNQ